MKRGIRVLRVYLIVIVLLLAADSAYAFGGPFSFSFASPLLNLIFLAPLTLVGCMP
jgi:hypothetical protein